MEIKIIIFKGIEMGVQQNAHLFDAAQSLRQAQTDLARSHTELVEVFG